MGIKVYHWDQTGPLNLTKGQFTSLLMGGERSEVWTTKDYKCWAVVSMNCLFRGNGDIYGIVLNCKSDMGQMLYVPVELVPDKALVKGKTNLEAFAAVSRGQAIVRRRDGTRFAKVASVGERPTGRLMTADHRVMFFDDEFDPKAMVDDPAEGFIVED